MIDELEWEEMVSLQGHIRRLEKSNEALGLENHDLRNDLKRLVRCCLRMKGYINTAKELYQKLGMGDERNESGWEK